MVVTMSSTRPYLLRAFYDWIVDNSCTPHIVVDATQEDVDVPTEFVDDGKIVLNIATQVVENLSLGDEFIDFRARFSGVRRVIHVPVYAIDAIYARENGRGMVFSEEDATEPPPAEDVIVGDLKDSDDDSSGSGGSSGIPSGKPHLTIVK